MGKAAKLRALNIGIDARELLGQPTGVGRFLIGVLHAWAEADDLPHRFTLFFPAPPPDWVARLGQRFTTVIDAGRPGTWWEQLRLPGLAARAGVDVFLSPGYTAPLRLACPSVVVVHDVSFFAHPEWFRWREGARRRWLTKASARRARVVVTVSEFSAREIERFLDVPRARIRIVRHGSPSVRTTDGSRRSPLVLFVGSLFNRRRLPELVGAFARVLSKVPEATLILVGDNRTSPPQDPIELAERLGVAERVRWLAYVPDEELNRLYDSARVFLFLSDYEGFAMTPLEALAHGVPPVLLDTPVAREVYESAARYVPPDVERIGAAVIELLTDESARARLLQEGARLLERYTWPRAGALVLEALERAAGRPARP